MMIIIVPRDFEFLITMVKFFTFKLHLYFQNYFLFLLYNSYTIVMIIHNLYNYYMNSILT